MSRSIPFRKLTLEQWQNLFVAGLLLFYFGQVAFDLLWANLLGNLGSDFAAFWSAGHIANHLGYRFVYDLEVMRQVQRDIVPFSVRHLAPDRTLPAAFLPVFLLPFQLLALLPAPTAFVTWSLLNLAGTVLYLRRFIGRLGAASIDTRLLILCMASAPVFLNIFLGQANLWLMICVGESLLALAAGRSTQSGAWLAGLLIKPQLLVLIVPALLLQRQFKALMAFGIGSAALICGSWLLAGSDAMRALGRLWLGYSAGLPTSDIQLMMNWRMLALHAATLLGESASQIILIAGSVLTSLVALAVAGRRTARDHTGLAIAAVGIWAATASVAWHSHVHSAVILIPPLLMLAFRRHDVGPSVLTHWILLPAAAFVVRVGLAALVRLGVFPANAYSWIDSLGAVAQFSVNLWLLIVAARLSGTFTASRPPAGAAAAT